MRTAASSSGGLACGGYDKGNRRRSGLFSKYGWLLLAAYNGIVFLIYAWDKGRARRHGWRTPEATLLWLAAVMGGAGALLAIYSLRHKTRKPKFTLALPAMASAQVALLWYLHGRGWW